jgi:tetratricopeptide (TPR) repeat protein
MTARAFSFCRMPYRAELRDWLTAIAPPSSIRAKLVRGSSFSRFHIPDSTMKTTPEIGQVLGHYRIVELIGSGGMGVVFRAHDEQLRRDVAVKILPQLSQLSEAARRQFRREALSVARITDANVAMAFDFGRDQGFDYLVTEYVPGITLNAKLAGRPLPEAEVLHLGKQLASGLENAHRQGVIHRDLKPGNLRVTPEGRLKILDFGLAFLLHAEAESASKGETTVTASVTASFEDAGTPPYMSPEQIKGNKPDARADVWSAGAVLYEMSTGRAPFGELTGGRLMAAILEQPPPLPRTLNPKISVGLERVILRALEKDPGERYQSAGDLRIDLNNLATGTLPIYAQPASPRWVWWLAAAATLVVALAGGGFWWTRRAVKTAAVEDQVMAVLPFESVANDAPTNALGAGFTETLTARLVQAFGGGHLQLVSTHDLAARGVKTSDEARREFGTSFVLEGSLQQEGKRIRITWSLVNSQTHTQIAANALTDNAGDMFGLQDHLIEDVLEKLPRDLEPGQHFGLPSLRGSNSTAYDAYLRGLGYLEDYKIQDNLESAIAEFKRAVAVDENYAPAYAAMGSAYNSGYEWKNRSSDWIEKAKAQCEHALAITPQLAEGHTCLGNVFVSTGRYEEAVREFQRAVDLDHNSDQALRSLATGYQKLGNASAAEEAYRKAVSLRPNYWGVYSAFGTFYFGQARYTDALAMFKRAIELAPQNPQDYSNLGATYMQVGQYSETVDALKKSIALRPDPVTYGNLGAAYFYLRRYEDSAETLQEALKIDDKDWQNWGSLGDALFQIPVKRTEALGAYQKAVDFARSRLEVNPRDANILAATADYYAILGQETRAKEQLARALQIAPADSDVLFRAAILYNHFSDQQKTLDFLNKSVAAGYPRTVIRDTPDFDHFKDDAQFRENILNPT